MNGRKASHPSRITIERTHNGGHIVEHYYDNSMAGESYRQPEKHAFGNHAAMVAHVRKHTSLPSSGGTATPAGVGRKMTGKAPGPRTYGAGVD